MWKDILKIDRYERAVAEEFADDEDYMITQQRGKALKEKWERMKEKIRAGEPLSEGRILGKLRSNAYQRLYQRLKRAPTKEEVEEELKNPTKRYPAHLHRKKWKKDIQNRPENYDKIEAIVDFLKKNNKYINRQNILEELVGLPTNEDNQAIEFILGE
jgi:hypothetical protein